MSNTVSITNNETAKKTIELFSTNFASEVATLEFKASQYLSGKHNASLRQAIIYRITGQVLPLNKCSLLATAEHLKAAIFQQSLF